MSAHREESGANTALNRVWLPLILPIVAAAITAVLIVAIGSLLLAFDTVLFDVGEEHIVTPVAIALGATVIVLLGATAAAMSWAKDE
jgi:hypothetical protein